MSRAMLLVVLMILDEHEGLFGRTDIQIDIDVWLDNLNAWHLACRRAPRSCAVTCWILLRCLPP